jgi:hypothetical protein
MMQGRKKGWEVEQCCGSGSIGMFFGLPHPDPNPVVEDTVPAPDPDPSIIQQKVRKTLIPSVLWLLCEFLSLKNYVNVALKSKKRKTWIKIRNTGVEESFPMITTKRGRIALLYGALRLPHRCSSKFSRKLPGRDSNPVDLSSGRNQILLHIFINEATISTYLIRLSKKWLEPLSCATVFSRGAASVQKRGKIGREKTTFENIAV